MVVLAATPAVARADRGPGHATVSSAGDAVVLHIETGPGIFTPPGPGEPISSRRVGAIGRLDVVAIDCNDPEPLVEFWSSLLGTSVRSREADWIALHPVPPDGPHLAFQIVPEQKTGKNRLHLDVNVDDLAAATHDTEALGATRVGDVVEEDDGRFQVMRDPGGNEFCLVEWDS